MSRRNLILKPHDRVNAVVKVAGFAIFQKCFLTNWGLLKSIWKKHRNIDILEKQNNYYGPVAILAAAAAVAEHHAESGPWFTVGI